MMGAALNLACQWWQASALEGEVVAADELNGTLRFDWIQHGALPGGRDNSGEIRLSMAELIGRLDNPLTSRLSQQPTR